VQVLQSNSGTLPDPKKAETQLKKFADLNDKRLYKLFRGIMDPSSDLKLVLKYKVILVKLRMKYKIGFLKTLRYGM
jgi:hypothetical protein